MRSRSISRTDVSRRFPDRGPGQRTAETAGRAPKPGKLQQAAARLAVKVAPRAKRDEIVGWAGGRLRVRVAAVPAGGKANDALEAFLADRAGVPRRTVRVVSGAASALKLVEFAGMDPHDLDRRFGRPSE